MSLVDERGVEVARGLSNYESSELAKIRGVRTERIAEILGHCPYLEVVHRNNLMLTG